MATTTTATATATDPKPLIKHLYTADPSAHVFSGRIYIYPSHDRDSSIADNDSGDQYDMNDYHVFSLSHPTGPVTDHGTVLRAEQIPWVSKQLWAPDAAEKDGTYYLYFPARDREGIFRIGVAIADKPEGPFAPDPEPIPGTFSIDPASFVDADGQAFLYFGGLWGGQLQCWQSGSFDASLQGAREPAGEGVRALCPKVARLSGDMRSFASGVGDLVILDPETGMPIGADDHERRFFEGAWMHRYRGRYYFSYSTGDTHLIAYAVGDSPLGPFTYRGIILRPVLGWTTHHSIVEFEGRWWLFYHDCELSKGRNHLRNVKVREVVYDEQGDLKLKDVQAEVVESAARLEG